MNPLRWLSALLLALALVAGASLWLQRQAAAVLRDEIVLLREESRELARLRAENQRLVSAKLPAPELERLRADHAAVMRLRSEIETLKDNVQQRERALAEPPVRAAAGTAPSSLRPPALKLSLAIGPDGGISLDGAPFDLEAIRPRLAVLPRGERVEVQVRSPGLGKGAQKNESTHDVLQAVSGKVNGIGALANEYGLQMSLRLVPDSMAKE